MSLFILLVLLEAQEDTAYICIKKIKDAVPITSFKIESTTMLIAQLN